MIYRKQDGIGWVQFNRPEKLNALNPNVFKDLDTVITNCEADDEIRVIVITGNEKAFAAGADIENMVNGDINSVYKLTDEVIRIQERLADLPKPTIAAIAGYTFGGGLEVALCCDFRIAADNSVFGFPEITLGVIPGGGGTQRLTRLVNFSAATMMILLGESIKSDKAKKIGLVHKVVPLDSLNDEVKKMAEKLIQKPSLALRAAKTAMRQGLNTSLKDGLKIEQDLFCMLFGTEDQKEGMTAFIEKRRPVFKGK